MTTRWQTCGERTRARYRQRVNRRRNSGHFNERSQGCWAVDPLWGEPLIATTSRATAVFAPLASIDSERRGRRRCQMLTHTRVARMPMTSVARALEVDETRGFMKAIVDADSGQILGAAVLGVEGGEVMSISTGKFSDA